MRTFGRWTWAWAATRWKAVCVEKVCHWGGRSQEAEKGKEGRYNPNTTIVIQLTAPVTRKKCRKSAPYTKLQEIQFPNAVDQVLEGPARPSRSIYVLSPEALRANSRVISGGTSESSKVSDLFPYDRLASRMPIMSLHVRVECSTISMLCERMGVRRRFRGK